MLGVLSQPRCPCSFQCPRPVGAPRVVFHCWDLMLHHHGNTVGLVDARDLWQLAGILARSTHTLAFHYNGHPHDFIKGDNPSSMNSSCGNSTIFWISSSGSFEMFGICFCHQRDDRRCWSVHLLSHWRNLNLKHPHCSPLLLDCWNLSA